MPAQSGFEPIANEAYLMLLFPQAPNTPVGVVGVHGWEIPSEDPGGKSEH